MYCIRLHVWHHFLYYNVVGALYCTSSHAGSWTQQLTNPNQRIVKNFLRRALGGQNADTPLLVPQSNNNLTERNENYQIHCWAAAILNLWIVWTGRMRMWVHTDVVFCTVGYTIDYVCLCSMKTVSRFCVFWTILYIFLFLEVSATCTHEEKIFMKWRMCVVLLNLEHYLL